MSDTSSRIGKTIGNLLIALINATLILVILAALSVGFALHSTQNFAVETAQRAAVAASEAVGLEPGRMAARLDTISDQLTGLRRAISEDRDQPALLAAVKTINSELESVRKAVEDLARPEIGISQETLDRLGAQVATVLNRLQSCTIASNGEDA